jgi:alkylhydroperoxidase family enzyme
MPRIQPDDSLPLPSNIENSSFATMGMLFRTMARRPAIMQSAMQLLEAAMRTGTIEPELKELLAIRVSQVNNCFY